MFTTNVQAVVFAAGSGSRMTQLTGGTGGSGMTFPKCLIKVCGNPLIYYPLKTLSVYGFQEVLIVHQDREDVRKEIEKVCSKLGMKADYLSVSEDDENFGTFQSLKNVVKSNKITKFKEDVLIISCDTVMDAPLHNLINFHKTHSSACTTLFLRNHVPVLPAGAKLPGSKVKGKPERDIIAVDPNSSRLVFFASEADFEDELQISMNALKSSPHSKIYTALVDSHVYLFHRSALDFCTSDEKVSRFLSVKGEFVPYLVNSQWRLPLVDLEMDSKEIVQPDLRLHAVILEENSCIRVNTIKALASATKSVDWLKQVFSSDVGGRANTTIAKSSKLVGSTLGDGCNVGEKVKVVNTIAMDNVTFEEHSTVENSIISFNVSVGAKAVLKDCIVGPGYQVPEGARFVNESLTVMEENLFGD